jgi:hypothetical protein
VVAAVVAERQLVRDPAQGRRQQLVSQADAEDGHAAQQLTDGLDREAIGEADRGGVAGAVGEEHAVGLHAQHVGRRRDRRDDGDLTQAGEVPEDGPLDAEVVGDDPARWRLGTTGAHAGRHRVGPGAGDGGDQVAAVGPGLADGGRPQRRPVGAAECARQRTGLADVPGQAAGVDPGDSGHPVPPEVAVEIVAGPPAGAAPGQVPHHDAPAERPSALVVVGVDPVVADVGGREGDDLPGVGRVGDDLLVARQHGVEHHLAGGDAPGRFGTDELALEAGPVGQHQQPVPHCPGDRLAGLHSHAI